MQELNVSDYENLIKLTQTNAPQAEVDAFVENFLNTPQFNQLQVFSNQAVRILDTSNLKYLYVGESIQELTGFSVDEIRKGGLLFVYKQTYMKDILRLTTATFKIKKAVKKLTPDEKMRARYSYDLRFICKNGTIKHILQNCHVLKLSSKHDPLILLFASTDITAYKKDDRMNYSLSIYDKQKGFVDVIKDSISDTLCPLSNRELEVLKQTSYGFSEKQIADTLNLSIETVKTHRRNMLQKMEVKNAIEMVRLAVAKNWI